MVGAVSTVWSGINIAHGGEAVEKGELDMKWGQQGKTETRVSRRLNENEEAGPAGDTGAFC